MKMHIQQAPPLWMGEFRLDHSVQCLGRNGKRIELVPQAWAVLDCLVERARQLGGRVEHVLSGRCAFFDSLDRLAEFFGETLAGDESGEQ